jgi:hypothetical protein
MADPIPFRRPIRWSKLRSDEAEQLVRKRVRDTGNVIIGRHALQRVRERFEGPDFTTEDVYWILETGTFQHSPVREDDSCWKVIVRKRCRARGMPVWSR